MAHTFGNAWTLCTFLITPLKKSLDWAQSTGQLLRQELSGMQEGTVPARVRMWADSVGWPLRLCHWPLTAVPSFQNLSVWSGEEEDTPASKAAPLINPPREHITYENCPLHLLYVCSYMLLSYFQTRRRKNSPWNIHRWVEKNAKGYSEASTSWILFPCLQWGWGETFEI